MADSILKLKVESSEYDSKLKKAAEGIRHLAEVAHRGGGELTGLEKAELDYIKALGDMDTKSRSASGKVRELTSAYKELTVTYNELNDVEKADEGGKALAASLEKLRARAQEAQAQMDVATKSLQANTTAGNEDSSVLSKLADKFTINVDAIKLFNIGMKAATTAAQVAKDAFFQSESGIDEWGRTVEGAKGAYNIFLDTLNNGNWSDFFQNLQTAIQGGRDLYDIFDRLGSIKSNNAAAIAIVQQQIAQLRLAKQQGENVDAQLKEATARLAQLQKQSITAGKVAGNKSAFEVIRNGVNSVGGSKVNDATIKYVVGQIMKNGQSEFDKYKYNYQNLRNRGMVTKTQTIYDSQGGTYERQYKEFDINALTQEQQKQYSLAKAITEGETRIQKGIAAYAKAVQEGTASAREQFKSNRYALQGSGGGGGKGGSNEITYAADSIAAMEADVSNLTKLWKEASAAVRSEYADALNEAKLRLDEVSGKTKLIAFDSEAAAKQVGYARGDREGLMTSGLGRLTQLPTVGEGLSKETMDYIKTLQQGGNDVSRSWRTAASAISQVGGALASIKNPAIDIMTVVGQAIATTALAYSQTLAKDATSKTNIWSFIAAAAAATVSMATTIAQIRANTGYAEGGIIKGNSYSGDNVGGVVDGSQFVGLNAGELVLTKAMQGNLASQLQDNRGGGRGGYTPSHVSGEQIWIALNAYTKRTGRGELVTWR